MLSAVVIVLCEVLEAAILTAVLLAMGNLRNRHKPWLFSTFLAALIIAAVVAHNIESISNAFDGIGQELMNAGSLMLASVLLLVSSAIGFISPPNDVGADRVPLRAFGVMLITALILIISVQREASEIIIYLIGFATDDTRGNLILSGSLIGLMLGVSCGILVYYSLILLSPERRRRVGALILALISAGMMSQGLINLMQAGILNSGMPVWNSSAIVAEGSIAGQLLYAAFGYEATPAWPQVIAYVSVLLLFVTVYWVGKLRGQAQNRTVAADG